MVHGYDIFRKVLFDADDKIFFNLQKRMVVPNSSESELAESSDDILTRQFMHAKESKGGNDIKIRRRFKTRIRQLF